MDNATNTTEASDEYGFGEISIDDVSFPGEEPVSQEQEESADIDGEPSSEPSAENTEEATDSAVEPEGEPAAEAEEENTSLSDEEYFGKLSQDTGYQLSSDEDLIKVLSQARENETRLKELESRDPFADYDPIVKDIANAKKAGLNIDAYMNARKLDVDSLDAKEAMRQKFMLDNADEDPAFAKARFEREYKAKYGLINDHRTEEDFDSPEEYQQFLDDKKFAEMSLASDERKSKQDLNKWKEQNVTIPDTPTGLSDEDAKKVLEEYHQRVDSTVSELEGLEFKVGDKDFQFGFDKDSKAAITEGLKNPDKTMKEVLGIDLESGNIDTNKLARMLALDAAFNSPTLGKTLQEFIMENNIKQTIEAKEANPKDPNSLGSAPETKSEMELVAEAFAAKRR